MKNYLILAMILIAGMTAYPQATRSARENKSEKGSTRKEATQQRTVTRSGSEKKSSSATQERKQEVRKSSNAQRSNNSEQVRKSSNVQRTESREPVRKSNNVQRTESREPVRKSSNVQRSNDQQENRTRTNSVERGDSQNRVTRQQNTITRPENRSENGGATRNVRESDNGRDRDFKVNSSSASRIYREGNGTLTRDDGTVIRHQNDEVFASRKYKLDFDNYEHLRRSDDFRRDYHDYDNWYHRRHIRVINHYHNHYIPVPWEIRRTRYYYRQPHHLDLIWTPLLFHRFMYYYPTHNEWNMEFGSQIETISAYEAQEYAGTVRRVYGKVDEVFYSPEDENYILYIGAPFPYQDISVVIPKHVARNISSSPKWYFDNEFVWVVGLINIWEGKPEIIVRDEDQIRKY